MQIPHRSLKPYVCKHNADKSKSKCSVLIKLTSQGSNRWIFQELFSTPVPKLGPCQMPGCKNCPWSGMGGTFEMHAKGQDVKVRTIWGASPSVRQVSLRLPRICNPQVQWKVIPDIQPVLVTHPCVLYLWAAHGYSIY